MLYWEKSKSDPHVRRLSILIEHCQTIVDLNKVNVFLCMQEVAKVFFIGCHQSWRSSVSEEHCRNKTRFLWVLGGLDVLHTSIKKKDTHTKSELKLLCSYMCINLGKTCINNFSMNHLCTKRGNKLLKLPCDNTSMFTSSHFPRQTSHWFINIFREAASHSLELLKNLKTMLKSHGSFHQNGNIQPSRQYNVCSFLKLIGPLGRRPRKY